MELRILDHSEFLQQSFTMFRVLADNMSRLHPGETVTAEDYDAWLAYQNAHFPEKTFLVLEQGGTLAGYLQYSVSGDVLTVEELEITSEWQNGIALRHLLRAMPELLPEGIQTVEAYIHKDNERSRRLAERLGLRPAGETESGKSLLYSAPKNLLKSVAQRHLNY